MGEGLGTSSSRLKIWLNTERTSGVVAAPVVSVTELAVGFVEIGGKVEERAVVLVTGLAVGFVEIGGKVEEERSTVVVFASVVGIGGARSSNGGKVEAATTAGFGVVLGETGDGTAAAAADDGGAVVALAAAVVALVAAPPRRKSIVSVLNRTPRSVKIAKGVISKAAAMHRFCLTRCWCG